MRFTVPVSAVWIALAVARLAPAQPADKPAPPITPQVAEFFETQIRPVLAENCYGCHGPKRQESGLRLDSRAALLKGTEDGPVLVPGQPEKSALVRVLQHQGDIKMPPRGKLPPQKIEALTTWVKLGAPWPQDKGAASGRETDAAKKHWAFQPVKAPPLPAVKNRSWVVSPIDAFVLSALEAKGLKPALPADRRTLLRRATYDLTGLPPTFAEIQAFEADKSADAFAKVVDRLLASPHYGERWGRHWLDVARYADTKGYLFEAERRYPYSYTYRDYVIRAFNEDLPYDQFVVQQLAADRLPLGADRRPLAAMGFLTLGRRFLNNPHDIIDDRIDVVTRGLLGLTVACARCHDHKFDPIPSKDYYSLYGVFASSVEPKDLPLIGASERTPEYLAFEKELQARKKAVEKYREEHKVDLAKGNRKFRDGLRALQKKVDQWEASSTFAPPRAMVLQDAVRPVTPRVFLRGNPSSPGPTVPRQFLRVLAGDKRQPFKEGSGRLDLARAIASKDNPLTARVFVNRLWLHHFGAGLVGTPSDFGLRSEPTHPQLLDYLAARFMADGWSIKKLHRLVMLSSTYQQRSEDNPEGLRLDPENRLLWKMNRRRLDFEQLRDSLLATSGKLDPRAGGAPVDLTKEPFTGRRTVYGFVERQNLPGIFRTFDFASPDATSPQRYYTTVPQQALFLMNSPFVLQQARLLMQRSEIAKLSEGEERIQALYRVLYGRAADAEEVALGVEFLDEEENAESEGTQKSTAWERYAQVLLLANEFVFVD
jgi:hypothetical protein